MRRFSRRRAADINGTRYLRIRCGDHRFIGIWVVVVRGRVFVRSWNDRGGGWFRAFRKHPTGAILVNDSEVQVRAVAVRGATLLDAVSDAYALKYTSKANLKYVKGFRIPRRRTATLELIPRR